MQLWICKPRPRSFVRGLCTSKLSSLGAVLSVSWGVFCNGSLLSERKNSIALPRDFGFLTDWRGVRKNHKKLTPSPSLGNELLGGVKREQGLNLIFHCGDTSLITGAESWLPSSQILKPTLQICSALQYQNSHFICTGIRGSILFKELGSMAQAETIHFSNHFLFLEDNSQL